MKKIILAALIFTAFNSAILAQPGSVRRDTVRIMDLREKLVQLALQNPEFEIADRRTLIAQYQLKKAKGSWLNPIAANANFNEFSFQQNPGINLFPKYNVGVQIPLDIVSQKRNEVRIAKENLLIAQAEKNERYRQIRAVVLAKYEDYVMYKEMLELQNRISQDENLAYLQAQNDFEAGLIEVADYNKAYRNWSDQQARKLELQRNLNVVKIELEQMIGVKLEEALGMP